MIKFQLGYPTDKITRWIKEKLVFSPYLYCKTVNGKHEHRLEVTQLSGEKFIDNNGNYTNIGQQICKVDNEIIYNRDITSISSDAGCTCTELQSYAFYGMTNMKLSSVSLPTVLSVGDSAFEQCTVVDQLNLPKAKYLGRRACFNMVSLGNPKYSRFPENPISFPECVELGESAFFAGQMSKLQLPKCLKISLNALMLDSSKEHPITVELNSMTTSQVLDNASTWGLRPYTIVVCKDGTITIN